MNVGIYSRIHESSSFTCNDRLKDFSKKKKNLGMISPKTRNHLLQSEADRVLEAITNFMLS